METISVESSSKVCVFCKRGTVDELNLGKLYHKGNVTCHYYCLLFACNLHQSGYLWRDSSDAIMMGFLLEDIVKEVKRVVATPKSRRFYRCKYCGKEGATIGCWNSKCKRVFHFPCGLENDANFVFSSSFEYKAHESYCANHRKQPVIKEVPAGETCYICQSTFEEDKQSKDNESQRYVKGTCCKTKFYHKDCVLKYALSVGSYNFKCPCCNSEDFDKEVQSQGVYIPDQDASWEREPGAFADLTTMGQCEMAACLCDQGRSHYTREPGSDWQLFKCNNCGSTGTHLKCSKLEFHQIIRWECETCVNLKLRKRKSSVISSDRLLRSAKKSKGL